MVIEKKDMGIKIMERDRHRQLMDFHQKSLREQKEIVYLKDIRNKKSRGERIYKASLDRYTDSIDICTVYKKKNLSSSIE